ncbi:MAG TPA: gluconate 2-dehydrogenase subunit 3 family protein [Blastocatellia bacterium]|nr:gluconate 2-dehydrogenase subunit 3 family protein [Blastocatellia bacterium]
MAKRNTLDDYNRPGGREHTDSKGQVSRREMIKVSAGAALAAPLIVSAAASAGEVSGSANTQNPTLKFFTAEEFSLVDELTELIIPADAHSPGARAAGVATYIDFRLSESWEEEPKKRWRDGLKLVEELSVKMQGKAFGQSTPEERIALLSLMSQHEGKPESPEEKFFAELKSRTVRAYYTSKIGIHDEMEYKGNVYLKEYVGYDAT